MSNHIAGKLFTLNRRPGRDRERERERERESYDDDDAKLID